MKIRRLAFPAMLAALCLPGMNTAAQTGAISGVITTPDLPAGSIVTVVASTDYFHGQHVALSTFAALGTSFNYTLTLPAPAAYTIAAVAVDLYAVQAPPPGTPIGIYNNYSLVSLAPGEAVENIDFSIAPDTQAPSAVITSIAEGSTIAALGEISGTASDNTGVRGIFAVARDLTTGQWWNSAGSAWESSTGSHFADAKVSFQDMPSVTNWRILPDSGGALGGLAAHLAPVHNYSISMFAVDLIGNLQSPRAVVNFALEAPPVYLPPEPVQTPDGSALGISSIAWSWPPSAGATGYAVYSDSGVFLSSVTEASFISAGLAPNTSVVIYVAAYNDYGASAPARSADRSSLAAVPGVPELVNITANTITIKWSTSGNAYWTSYNLLSSTDNFQTVFSNAAIDSWGAGEVSWTLSGLEPDTFYYLKVRARNGNDIPTEYSSMVSAKTLVPYPQPPVNPTAFIVESGKIMFSWDTPSGQAPSSYSVYRSSAAGELEDGGIPNPLLQISSNNITTSIIDSPGTSALFYYAATAFNSIGQESRLSEAVPIVLDLWAPTGEIIFSSPAVSLGLGSHPFRLIVSEVLAFPPTLTITPDGQSPVLLRLEPETPTIWKGTFTVTQQTNSGAVLFSFSAEDLAGNTGTAISGGNTIRVDTKGPSGYIVLSAVSIS